MNLRTVEFQIVGQREHPAQRSHDNGSGDERGGLLFVLGASPSPCGTCTA